MNFYKKSIVSAIMFAFFLTGCNDIHQDVYVETNGNGDKSSTITTKDSFITESSDEKNTSANTEAVTTTINMTEQVLDEAKSYATKGNYIPAIDIIKKAQKDYGDNDAYNEALEYYYKAYRIMSVKAADDLASDGDYLQAIKVINKTAEITGATDELTTKAADYKNSYALSVISSADEAVSSDDYDNAVKIIEDALKQMSDNALLKDKLNDINSKKPVDVINTEILYDGSRIEKINSNGEKKFCMGSETFNKGFIMSPKYYEGAIALFDLKGKYSHMTFRAGRTNDSPIEDTTLQIYLDGELLEEYSMDAKTPIKSFDIPLNNVEYMQFNLSNSGKDVSYGFVDVMLYSAE